MLKRLVISDLHLGGGFTRIDCLLQFIDKYEFEELILLGDLVDFWRMSKKVRWRKKYNRLIEKIIGIARKKKVIWVVGNHDEYMRKFVGEEIFRIKILDEYESDGILFIHGDKFDNLIKKSKWLYYLGDWAYFLIQKSNHWLKYVLWLINKSPYSLAKTIKQKAKKATNFLNDFYGNAEKYANLKGVHTIVCGHTHMAEHKKLDSVDYYNTGDWVESGTGLIEHLNGKLELVDIDDLSR